MERKLFCEISPLTYQISMYKCITMRHIKNILGKEKLANTITKELIRENHAKVCYDTSNLEIIDIPTNK